MSRTYRRFHYWNEDLNFYFMKPFNRVMDKKIKYRCNKLYKNIDNNKRRTEDKIIINNYFKEYNENE